MVDISVCCCFFYISFLFRFAPAAVCLCCARVCGVWPPLIGGVPPICENVRVCVHACVIYFFHLTSLSIITAVFLFYHFAIFIYFISSLFRFNFCQCEHVIWIDIAAYQNEIIYNHLCGKVCIQSFRSHLFCFLFLFGFFSFLSFRVLLVLSWFSMCGIFFHFSFIFSTIDRVANLVMCVLERRKVEK